MNLTDICGGKRAESRSDRGYVVIRDLRSQPRTRSSDRAAALGFPRFLLIPRLLMRFSPDLELAEMQKITLYTPVARSAHKEDGGGVLHAELKSVFDLTPDLNETSSAHKTKQCSDAV